MYFWKINNNLKTNFIIEFGMSGTKFKIKYHHKINLNKMHLQRKRLNKNRLNPQIEVKSDMTWLKKKKKRHLDKRAWTQDPNWGNANFSPI